MRKETLQADSSVNGILALAGTCRVTTHASVIPGGYGAQAEQTLRVGVTGEIQHPVRTNSDADRASQALSIRVLEATYHIDHISCLAP